MIKELVRGVQHLGLPTADMDETLAFYHGLGFDTAFQTRNGGDRVAFLRLGELTIETYESKEAAGRPGAIDHVALDVADVDGAFQAMREGGYHLLDSQVQFLPFWEKGVRFFTILGPNGEKIEFSQML